MAWFVAPLKQSSLDDEQDHHRRTLNLDDTLLIASPPALVPLLGAPAMQTAVVPTSQSPRTSRSDLQSIAMLTDDDINERFGADALRQWMGDFSKASDLSIECFVYFFQLSLLLLFDVVTTRSMLRTSMALDWVKRLLNRCWRNAYLSMPSNKYGRLERLCVGKYSQILF